MLKRIIHKRFFSKIYGIRTISKLGHMSKAQELKEQYLKSPEEPQYFIDYLKELNKAGQKDLVKMEVNRYKRDIENKSIKHYLKLHSQYEIAEKGRYRRYKIPIFSIMFFLYLGYYLMSHLLDILGNRTASEESEKKNLSDEEKKKKNLSDEEKEKKNLSDEEKEKEKKKEEEEKKLIDIKQKEEKKNGKDVKTWTITLNFGKKEKKENENKEEEKDGEKEKEEENETKTEEKEEEKAPVSEGKKENKTWLFQDVYNSDIQPVKDVKVKFADVLGIDEYKHEFEEIVDFLKNPEKYKIAGANIPKGILLVGSPGCGKTLMAKALAGESKCSFFYKSGAEFEEVYVGVGARRMRDLFTAAKKHAPSIIFIDEIDSLAGKRGANEASEHRQCINQMLAEMDGFRKNDSVIVIGATNLEQSLDPAIKRSGRFDKIVRIPLPDIKGREMILSHFSKSIKMKGVDLKMQSRRTIGFTGADLKNFINTAILHGVKKERDHANLEDFDFAYDRIKMGVRRANLLADEHEKRVTAIHEIGHALVCKLTKGATPLYKVTILPSGQSLGHTAMVPEKDMLTQNRKNIEAAIDIALGGRAAEEVFLGLDNVTTGCSSDLQNATNVAYSYVRDLGLMEDEVFINQRSELLSEKYKFKVDKMVQKLLKESLERTKKLIEANKGKVELLVEKLIENETLSAAEFEEYLLS